MQKIKFILFLFTVMLFVSCSEDDYETDENYGFVGDGGSEDGDLYLASGTVIKSDENFQIQLDTDSILKIKEEEYYADQYENGERVLVYYYILEEGEADDDFDLYVSIYSIVEILTKSIVDINSETTQEVIDSIGEDPIKIVDAWITDDYLNVQFEYYGYDQAHYVNLVYDENNPTTEDGQLLLELRHNDNGDTYTNYYWSIISFDISGLQESDATYTSILVKAYNYEGEYDYSDTLTYSYGTESTSLRKEIVPVIDYDITDRNPKGEY